MLSRLIAFALAQRLLMLLVVVLLAGSGWYAFTQTPIDAFPDVSTTQVKVIIKAPGMTPEEVETRITALIEVEMLGIPRQSTLRSITKYALTDITVDFEEGTDIYWARQQVAERLSGIWEDLPGDISGGLAPLTTPLGEMFMFAIEGGGLDLQERRALLDWVIRPALRGVPGVADVNALGGSVTTFEVRPDNARMSARGISNADLFAALQENNRNDGAGRLTDGEETLLIRAEGAIQTLDDLAGIIVKQDRMEPIRVGDIATVQLGSLTRYGAVTRDGQSETVQGLVLGLRGANAREVVQGVRQRLDELAAGLPEGVRIDVFYDRGRLVDRAVGTVSTALLEASVLVILLLAIFLGDLRAALTAALVLPLAALITFIMMYAFGMSANLMSLGGLAIAIGMLVDAAVVVVENVVTQLSKQGAHTRLPQLHLIYRAAAQVARPVASGILIIIVVFLPLLTLEGLEGKLFVPVAMTIVFALGGSLLLSLTVIPVLASVLMGPTQHREPWLMRILHRVYAPALNWSLQNPRIVIGVAATLLAGAAGLYTQIGKTFMPTMDEGDVIVQLEKLPSITLDRSVDLDLAVQRAILAQVPEVTGVVARTGSDELGLDPMGLNETDSFLVLKPQAQWRRPDKAWLVGQIRQILDQFPGVGYTFTQPIEMRVSEMLTGVRGDLAIKIFGSDQNDLNRSADAIVAELKKIQGAEDVFTSRNEGAQYQRLIIDRLAVGRLGLSVDTVAQALRAQVEGTPNGTVYQQARRIPLVIKGSAGAVNSPQQLDALRITLPDGSAVPLSALARFERVEGPVAISHERGNRMAVVAANVSGRDLVGFVTEAKARVAENVRLPVGYYLEWGGQFENQQRAANRLSVVVPVAIGLIFLILFSTFRSVRQSVLVLTNIPFALVGGVAALWFSGEYLSVPASVGFIALLGIAVLNGVVMVSYFNELRDMGKSISETILSGSRRRLRPVLMTASIAAFGLLPLLFTSGPGSEVQRPLAIVVIGGLISSTLLTLILLPILYQRFGAKT